MNKKISIIMKQLIVPVICFSLIISLNPTAWAGDPDEPLPEDTGVTGMELIKDNVTINKKSSEMLATGTGGRYKVNEATMVVGKDGSQIMLQYMLVPCDAQVVYETTSKGEKLVHRIIVVKTHPNATNSMSDKPK